MIMHLRWVEACAEDLHEDCYAVSRRMTANASEIRLDPARLAVGASVGGGFFGAGLAPLAWDRGEFGLAFQMLIHPMFDDRNVTQASHETTDPRLWNREANLFGWRCYLGEDADGEGVSPYTAPIRAADLAGLLPAYIAVGA